MVEGPGGPLTDNPIGDLDDPKRFFPWTPPIQRPVHQEPQTSSKNEPLKVNSIM